MITAQHVTDRVKKDFRPEDVDEALGILDQYGKDEWDMSPAEFIRLAILRVANGNIKKLPSEPTKWATANGCRPFHGLDGAPNLTWGSAFGSTPGFTLPPAPRA